MKHGFFTIVLNGQPLIEPILRHACSMFDYGVCVEGASLPIPPGRGDGRLVTGGGASSTDGTVAVLKHLEKELSNLTVVYSAGEPWRGKAAMCDAAMDFCEPGWIWQVDSDEAFFPDQVELMRALLDSSMSHVTDVEYYAHHFWPSVDYHTALNPGQFGNALPWRRTFRWQGESWASHEPPRLQRSHEVVLSREDTRILGVLMFHFGYCVESQFIAREKFYGMPPGRLVNERNEWLKTRDLNNSPAGALVEFKGERPIDVSFLRTENRNPAEI